MIDAEKVARTVEQSTGGRGEPPDLRISRALFWPELAARPRPEYTVKGLIDIGAFAEIFGPTGSGKSFEATDLGLHVALGRPWNGCRVRQGGVLYVSAEGGAAIINRLDAWSRYHNEILDDVPFAVVLDSTNVLDAGGVEQVIADAAKVPDLALIIIDTAARVMPGSDEGAEDMSTFVAACDRIRAATSAAVLVVHHTGKDASRGSRGSSVLPAAVDSAIEITRDGDARTATVTKARDGETGRAFPFRLQVVELGKDADDDPVTSCVAVPAEASDSASRQRLSPKQRRALDVSTAAG